MVMSTDSSFDSDQSVAGPEHSTRAQPPTLVGVDRGASAERAVTQAEANSELAEHLLLVACFCAYLVAEGLGQLPIYEALLQRDLRRGGVAHILHEPAVLELAVEPGAPFVGRQIRELGLPAGCIIVRCRDGGREWVPTADTRIEAHMRLTAVVDPEAVDGPRALREGCEAPL